MVRWRVIYDPEFSALNVTISGLEAIGLPSAEYTVEYPVRYGPLRERREHAIREMNEHNERMCPCSGNPARLQTVFIDDPASDLILPPRF